MSIPFNNRNVFIPKGMGFDWAAIAAEPSVPIVITNCPMHALRLCQAGQPAIAVVGMSKTELQKWFRKRHARVSEKGGMH